MITFPKVDFGCGTESLKNRLSAAISSVAACSRLRSGAIGRDGPFPPFIRPNRRRCAARQTGLSPQAHIFGALEVERQDFAAVRNFSHSVSADSANSHPQGFPL